jgi:hypothetical protein
MLCIFSSKLSRPWGLSRTQDWKFQICQSLSVWWLYDNGSVVLFQDNTFNGPNMVSVGLSNKDHMCELSSNLCVFCVICEGVCHKWWQNILSHFTLFQFLFLFIFFHEKQKQLKIQECVVRSLKSNWLGFAGVFVCVV